MPDAPRWRCGLFTLDDDGYIATDGFEVPAGEDAKAARAARACPERIITIVDDNR
jgi:ferredoxin